MWYSVTGVEAEPSSFKENAELFSSNGKGLIYTTNINATKNKLKTAKKQFKVKKEVVQRIFEHLLL